MPFAEASVIAVASAKVFLGEGKTVSVPHCGTLRSIEPNVYRDRLNMNVNTGIAATVRGRRG